jgi:hypothetical protein
MDLPQHENAQRMVAVINTAMSRGPVNPVELGRPEDFRKVCAAGLCHTRCNRFHDCAADDHESMGCRRLWTSTLSAPRSSFESGFPRSVTTGVSECSTI